MAFWIFAKEIVLVPCEFENCVVGKVPSQNIVNNLQNIVDKEGNSKGGENNGRLLIGFYYSAVTGNRKQVFTGSSESCEHKCR